MLVSLQRFIVVRVKGREVRIPTTDCQWCSDEGVCAVCSAKAEAARKHLAEQSS